MDIADRMRTVRDELGLTQKDVSSRLEISHRTWQDYESGKNLPNGKVLKKLALMGFNANWILTGEGPINTDVSEVIRHSYHYAHDKIREEIKNKNKINKIIEEMSREKDEYCKISKEQLLSYVYDDGYIPTYDQLGKICSILEIDSDSDFHQAFKVIINIDNRLISSNRRIDKFLLGCIIEATEDKDVGMSKLSARKKAEIVNLAYTMNTGKVYSTEQIKKFLIALLTVVGNVEKMNKIPDEELYDLLFKIAGVAAKSEHDSASV